MSIHFRSNPDFGMFHTIKIQTLLCHMSYTLQYFQDANGEMNVSEYFNKLHSTRFRTRPHPERHLRSPQKLSN